MRLSLRSILHLIFVIVFSFWAIKPLLHSGFFPMHDDTQPSRVYEMVKALSSGQFPVRWLGDLGYGYGYPLFNFYAPLPYYVGAIFNLIGFDILIATKIMFGIGILLAGITMFLLLNSLADDLTAIVGSLLYMYAPYHAVDVYVRGAVGEFYAMAFLPLILLGVVKIIRPFYSSNDLDVTSGESRGLNVKSSRQAQTIDEGIAIGSVGLAGILLSHNILGMITMYFLAVGLVILLIIALIPSPLRFSGFLHPRGVLRTRPGCFHRVVGFKALLFAVLLGLGLSAFFILPAIFEKDFTRVDDLTQGTNNFANHFVYPDQLWSSPWGYAGSAPGRLDGMSFMIGKIHLLLGLLAILVIFISFKYKKIDHFQFSIFNFQLALFLISIFLMLEQSKFIWDILPGFNFIQYPWRFLAFTAFSLSAIIPISLLLLKKDIRIIISAILIIAIIGFNAKYFTPKEYLDVGDINYISPLNLRFRISKISDEYLPKDFLIPKSASEVSWRGVTESGNLRIINSFESPSRKIYTIDVIDPEKLLTNIAYFPGWQAFIDKKYTPMVSSNGRIELEIPSGWHEVEFILKDTPIRKAANAISILALFLLLYIIVFRKKAYARKENS